MKSVFAYAQSQMWGMQFEPFVYINPDGTFTWNPKARVKNLCVFLTVNGFNSLAYMLFVLFVKVQ